MAGKKAKAVKEVKPAKGVRRKRAAKAPQATKAGNAEKRARKAEKAANKRAKRSRAAEAVKSEPDVAPSNALLQAEEVFLVVDGLGSESDLHLLESGDWSDTEINCHGKRWTVHKSILCNRCRWFRDMFMGPWANSRGKVYLHEQHYIPEKIDWLLRFTYGRQLTIKPQEYRGRSSIEVAIELWYVGDYFKLPELCNQSMIFMQDSICQIIADQTTVTITQDVENDVSVRMKFWPLEWAQIVGVVKTAYHFLSPHLTAPRMKALTYFQGVAWRHSQDKIEKLYNERPDFVLAFASRITEYCWMNDSLFNMSKEMMKEAILDERYTIVCGHSGCESVFDIDSEEELRLNPYAGGFRFCCQRCKPHCKGIESCSHINA